MPTQSSFTRLDPISCRLVPPLQCPVSTAPVRVPSPTSTKQLECRLNLLSLVWTLSPADWSLRSSVRCRLPLSVSRRQLPVSSFVQPTLFSRPVTISGPAEISSPKTFVWFRAKTDKGIVCLAGHLHSDARALANAVYPFIPIAPRSTLARSGSTWQGPIDGSNRNKVHTYSKLNCSK